MPKSSKRFVIISNKVNRYGYRVDTTGMDIDQYQKNPILLFMHGRAFADNTNAVPAIGHIQELQLEANGNITGVPFLSDNDEFAMQIFDKIEEGTYRMLSAGFTPTELSADLSIAQEGQLYETVTKSRLNEVSVVDIGGDDNALALYHEGTILRLDGSNDTAKLIPSLQLNTNNNMKEVLIPMLLLVGLPQDGTQAQLMDKLASLKSIAEGTATQLAAKDETITQLHEKIGVLELAAINASNATMVDEAVALGKITIAQKEFYLKLAQSDAENVKQLLASMPETPRVKDLIAGGSATPNEAVLQLDYSTAHRTGKLAEIMANYPERYKLIFKEKFGKEPSM
jgi:Mu-like prophage I protein